jgi:hypothetical protein
MNIKFPLHTCKSIVYCYVFNDHTKNKTKRKNVSISVKYTFSQKLKSFFFSDKKGKKKILIFNFHTLLTRKNMPYLLCKN